MKYYLNIFLFLITWNVLAGNDSLKVVSSKKKIEKNSALIGYKFETGEYDEVIKQAEGYSGKKYFVNAATGADRLELQLYKAKALYVKLLFGPVNNVLQQAATIQPVTQEDAARMHLLFSGYYLYTGDYLAAQRHQKRADSLSSVLNDEKLRYDVALALASIQVHTGFYKEALERIGQQKEYRKLAAEDLSEKSIYATGYNAKTDLRIRKKNYAEVLDLTTQAMVYFNTYDQAYRMLEEAKDWVGKHLGKNGIDYMHLQVTEARLKELNNNQNGVYLQYKQAYVGQEGSEYEENKLNNLSAFINAQLTIGDEIGAANYLRRLQMYAFRQLGKDERVQLTYDYTQAYRQFINGELKDASQRLKSLRERFSSLPENHPYAFKINELEIAIAQKRGDVASMQRLRLEHAQAIEKYHGKQSPYYHRERLVIAVDEIYYGKNLLLAENIFKESYDGVIARQLEESSKENILYLQAYADLYVKTDRFEEAAEKQLKAALITKKIYSRNSPEYVRAIARYTEYLINAGKYKTGLDSIRAVNALIAQVKGGKPETRQAALISVATLNNIIGEYDESQSYLKQAVKLNARSNYEQDILLESETAEQLASLNIQTGNYYRVEKILKSAHERISLKLGENSPRLIPVYFAYANLHLIRGNYASLDAYIESAHKIIDSVYGPNSLLMADCQLLYGDYYSAISDYKKAEAAYAAADNIQKQKLGKKHLKRAETLLRQATLSGTLSAGKTTIEKLYKEALEIVKDAMGTANPLYAEVQQRYAEFLIAAGSYEVADKLLEETDKFWVGKLGKDNKYTADISGLRGDIAYAKGKYEEAEKKYSKSKEVYASLFGEKHPDYVKSIGKLARVYYMKKQPEKALDLMGNIIPTYLTYTREIFPSLSFRQKTKFWNNLKEEFEFYTLVALQQPKGANLKYTGTVYNNILSTKALLLSSSIKLLEKITHSNDSILIGLYNEWIAEKEYQISILSLNKHQLQEQGIHPEQIGANIERLEKEMSQRSELFHKEKLATKIVWEDVRAKLKDNEYAVELIRFRYFNKVFTDSVLYAALIIDRNTRDNPDMVLFPNGKQMEKRYMKYYRNVATLNAPDEYSYDVYWQPIKSKIPDGALVYLSSDGVYNQINLEMLPVKGTETYVIDQNQIVLLTNTKDLLLLEEIHTSSTAKKKSRENKKAMNSNAYVFCGSPVFYTGAEMSKKNVPDLPGAEKEILELNSLLASADKSTLLLMKTNVTEDTIKSLRSPKVLHIATHGYFKESVSTGAGDDDIANNPLLNSGLMLLGAGDIVDNPDNKYVNQKEGILTAYEAMDLPLENTDIVVLSACETGRGEVQVGEGVYGLQRAFLMAGAKSIIISLFKVNDEVTQKLMVSFYQKWLKTGDKRTAFTEAKKEIKQLYKEPLYWGAFLMIEGRPERFASNP